MIVTRTPLRVSFAGGGSDMPSWYNRGEAGAVVSAAINRYIYVMAGPHFDPHKTRVAYLITENVRHRNDLHHDLVREAMKVSGIETGLELATVGEVPGRGTGLGSSAAVTVGVLHALARKSGITPDPQWLAEKACFVEITALRKPSGKQDQYASAFGGINHMVFHPSGQVEVRPLKMTSVTLQALNKRLMLFYTGRHRQSQGVLEETAMALQSEAKAEEMRKMVGMVAQTRDCLELGRLDDFAAILHEGWQRKRSLTGGISTDDINMLYDRALEAGAIGGKLCGAGGGGFLLLYVPEERRESVKRSLKLPCMGVEYGVAGSECLFAERRRDTCDD